MQHMENTERYQECIEACLDCIKACNHCFAACLAENDPGMMAGCIRLDRECADICSFAIQAMTRSSPFTADIMALCASVCEACGQECARHDLEHCRECAKACEACAVLCRKMAEAA